MYHSRVFVFKYISMYLTPCLELEAVDDYEDSPTDSYRCLVRYWPNEVHCLLQEKMYLILFVVIGVTSGSGYVYASLKNYNELQRTRAQQNHTGWWPVVPHLSHMSKWDWLLKWSITAVCLTGFTLECFPGLSVSDEDAHLQRTVVSQHCNT